MSKNDQIRRLIEAIVRKELKQILPEVVPQVVKEVMAGMIMEAAVTPQATQFRGNSEKRIRMTESARSYVDDESLYEDEVPMASAPRRRPAVEWDGGMGPGRLSTEGFGGGGYAEELNVPTKAATETGNLVPINPNAVPKFIIEAMNRNYSGFLKEVGMKTTRHG